MPVFERGELRIHYESRGEGFPVLVFAPGGMRSSAGLLSRLPFDVVSGLEDRFRVITMDQRNAGQSSAPLSVEDGWHSYTEDQLALLEHLGIERCHLLGCCIGGSFILSLLKAAPERVAAAVLLQPIGLEGNRQLFREMYDGWADELRAQRPKVPAEAFKRIRERMYGGDFTFSVSQDYVRSCATPMLVCMGDDPYHPRSISRQIVELAQNAELVERWKDGAFADQALGRISDFLQSHIG